MLVILWKFSHCKLFSANDITGSHRIAGKYFGDSSNISFGFHIFCAIRSYTENNLQVGGLYEKSLLFAVPYKAVLQPYPLKSPAVLL